MQKPIKLLRGHHQKELGPVSLNILKRELNLPLDPPDHHLKILMPPFDNGPKQHILSSLGRTLLLAAASGRQPEIDSGLVPGHVLVRVH